MGPLSLTTISSVENRVFYNSVIDSYGELEKNKRQDKSSNRPIEVAGDGRSDSIGFSVFHCCYPNVVQ